ncbi:Hypp1637 [Branchiostoma lanceolatum]|uniref:Hypp1637 protein n=1 Tax=Branchiostoma lanceolatum TaxID=7740 RepID=A0A8J9ZJB1_BRALA|nr:Hypp1637 [Branchiostoma lanceolatum]
MPRSRSRRDMTLLQAILDTEGFGESEHPGSDSTLNTTSSTASNPRAPRPADPCAPRPADPLDLTLQQKHRELQLLLWQQHVERQVLMQRQVLQQQVVMHRSSYPQRRGKRGRQLRGPVNIPVGSIPPPVRPHHPAVTTNVPTQVQKLKTKVESSTQTMETVTLAPKEKDAKTEENRRRETKSRKEQDQDRHKERRSKQRGKELSLKHRNEEQDEKRSSSEQDNKAHRKGRKKENNSAQILREEPKPEGQTKAWSRQEGQGQDKEISGLRVSEEGRKGRDDSERGHQKATGHRHGDALGDEPRVGEDGDSSHHHGNKNHHCGDKDHHHGDKDHQKGDSDHQQGDGNLHDENGNLHGDSSIEKESPHKNQDPHHEVKGRLHGDSRDEDDASDSEFSDSERSYSSHSESFSSSEESDGSGEDKRRSGSDEGTAKRVTFAKEGRREEKNELEDEDREGKPAQKVEELTDQKEVKGTAGKRKKPRQQSAGRKRTSTHPQFTVTSLSSRYLSLVSSLLELQLSPQPPGKERPRTLSSPGKNISEEILKKRVREEKKKKRMEKKQEEEAAASPREKQPFQSSDHNLKNSSNPQVQEWLHQKQAVQRQQRREERAKRRLKFQMKMEERDVKIARMIESDEKVDQWMREKRKLLRRKSQKPRKAMVQPSVGQQAETVETTPLSNHNHGQPDLPSLEKQATQLEEKLLKDLGAEKGQGDATPPAGGKVGNTTTSPSDGKVAGMDDFARRTVPARQTRTENGAAGAQTAGKVPSRPTTAPPRSDSPTKRRGKSLHPMSARSRGSKTSVETPRSVGSGSGTPRDPMRNLSYDQWLVHKRREDQRSRLRGQKDEADPEMQSIIPELGRRRVEQATMRRKKLDTGLKHRKQDQDGKDKPAENPDNKPRFVWRLRDDPTLERPTTARPGSRSPSPGKKSPSPRRPASPLKEPAFYRRQRFSKDKMQQMSQSMNFERPEPQGSDCPDVTTHDSNGQSQGSFPSADQSEKGTTEAVIDQSEKETAEAVIDQSEKGMTEGEAIINQSEGKAVDQSESVSVKADSQSLFKSGSDQPAPACKKTDQSVNRLFAALGLSDEIEENIESKSESETEEEKVKNNHELSSSQTFLTTVADTEDGSCG